MKYRNGGCGISKDRKALLVSEKGKGKKVLFAPFNDICCNMLGFFKQMYFFILKCYQRMMHV